MLILQAVETNLTQKVKWPFPDEFELNASKKNIPKRKSIPTYTIGSNLMILNREYDFFNQYEIEGTFLKFLFEDLDPSLTIEQFVDQKAVFPVYSCEEVFSEANLKPFGYIKAYLRMSKEKFERVKKEPLCKAKILFNVDGIFHVGPVNFSQFTFVEQIKAVRI